MEETCFSHPVNKPIDWEEIGRRKQKAIAKSNQREGDWITFKCPGIIRKLSVPKEGPFRVIRQHNNGTVTYEKEPFVDD